MARSRTAFNRRVYSEIASSPAMADFLGDVARRGLAYAESIAPTYSGPTWTGESRSNDYKKSLEAKVVREDFGWHSEIAANADHALQVEFGSGRPATTQERPQEGRSPKQRVLGRTLDSLRI